MGEEYVPSNFRTLVIPQELARVRNLLFSPDPDRAMLNYRLRQYLTLLHTTELEQYVLALDPRVTYWPLHDTNLFKETTFGTVITLTGGSSTWSIGIVGNPTKIKNSTQLRKVWKVDVLSGSSVRVTLLTQGGGISISGYTLTNNISNNIPLIGSDLSFNLTGGTTSYPSWEVRHVARPLLELPDVYVGLKAGTDSAVQSLFSADTEPYRTCKRLWLLDQGPIAHKLGAVVLALGYKLNEIYMNTNRS